MLCLVGVFYLSLCGRWYRRFDSSRLLSTG
nr:MAG TPA_asm: hypothetical protein [Caudoviricetes sp.]